MATYDYRCRTCDAAFEVRRSVTADAGAVTCPDGHSETSRVWSAVAVGSGVAEPVRAGGGGGCCGGGCCS